MKWTARWIAYLAVLLAFACVSIAQTPVRFARYPAPSPDGKQIVFSWQGDLWLVASTGVEAKRLTVHEGYDYAPIWSPDGTRIAFTSDRYGNDDVFVLNLRNGSIQRLTFWSGRDRALGWTPDGKAVLFESSRDWEPYGAAGCTYVAPLSGGTPYRLHDVLSTSAALSPNGEQVAFVRRDSAWWRKGYRGSASGDIWIHHLKQNRLVRLTEDNIPDTQPLWSPDGKTLYFLSERDGTYNLWAMEMASRVVKQLTRYRGDGIRFPQIARNANLIAYEQGMDICTINPVSGEIRALQIVAPAADVRKPQEVWRPVRGDVSEYVVAPNGKEVAFVVRGEVFVTRYPDGGAARRLTETVEPEYGLTWSPDSKSLVFASERDGTTSLYLVTSDDPEEPRLRRTSKLKTERLTNSPQPDTSSVFSPDGKKIAFRRGNGDLVLLDMEKKEERTLLHHWNLGRFVWSPDSRWVAYEKEDNEYNSDIYILSVEDGKSVNISRHPNNDINPSWSADGKALAFLSQRDGRNFNVCYLFLRKSDDEKSKADWQDEEDARHDAPKKPEEKPREQKPEKEPVQIDFEDIHNRVRQITRHVGGVQEIALSPDGKKIAFRSSYQGQSDLYVIGRDGSDEKRLTTSGASPTDIRWSSDGNTLIFLSRGRISRISAGGGAVQFTDFNAQMRVDLAAEREYVFDAVWRTLNEVFYDSQFHGTDWASMRLKYRPYLQYVSEDRDFSAVVYMMLGELNSSHVGFTPRQTTNPESTQTGMLGVVWANSRDGEGLMIEAVIPNTPAARTDVNLKPGERVLAINGKRITPTTKVWELLNGTVGEKTALLIRASDGNERTVTLRPISSTDFRRARYEHWTKHNSRWVEEQSGGMLGYVHIQGMGEMNVYEFIRQLHAVAYGKKGLVIDVRFNGGGWTTDYLLAILMAKRHAYTLPRGGEPGYPQDRLPLYVWTKPIAVLCNERSFSNAEIFTHAIKTLKRGPVIGMPTGGGVISTGRRTLVDGSSVATPGRGWFTIDKGVNMEHNGAMPDYLVEDMPQDPAEGRDRQLSKAVDVLMRIVHDSPPEFPRHRVK